MRVKTVYIKDKQRLKLSNFPNFSVTGSIAGMKKIYETSATDQKRAFLYALHKMGIVCKRGRMAVVYDGNTYESQDRHTGGAIVCSYSMLIAEK